MKLYPENFCSQSQETFFSNHLWKKSDQCKYSPLHDEPNIGCEEDWASLIASEQRQN